jgi:sialate O-acetylesterase
MKSITTLSLLFLCVSAQAELRLPAIISDHMVLQQQQSNAIWGWDTAGTEVKVSFAGKTVSGKAGQDGKWRVKLPTGAANAQPQVLTVEGSSKRSIQDVLVGEVWLCSGQSNMGFAVGNATDSDLVLLGAADPLLRLVSVPNVGTQVIQDDFQGAWAASDGARCWVCLWDS